MRTGFGTRLPNVRMREVRRRFVQTMLLSGFQTVTNNWGNIRIPQMGASIRHNTTDVTNNGSNIIDPSSNVDDWQFDGNTADASNIAKIRSIVDASNTVDATIDDDDEGDVPKDV